MLRVKSSASMRGFTEYEDDILFDQDDPDFNHGVASVLFRGKL